MNAYRIRIRKNDINNNNNNNHDVKKFNFYRGEQGWRTMWNQLNIIFFVILDFQGDARLNTVRYPNTSYI